MKKLEVLKVLLIFSTGISFFYMIKIDNEVHFPANIYTDYHMNALPFIYLISGSLILMMTIAFLRIRSLKKKK